MNVNIVAAVAKGDPGPFVYEASFFCVAWNGSFRIDRDANNATLSYSNTSTAATGAVNFSATNAPPTAAPPPLTPPPQRSVEVDGTVDDFREALSSLCPLCEVVVVNDASGSPSDSSSRVCSTDLMQPVRLRISHPRIMRPWHPFVVDESKLSGHAWFAAVLPSPERATRGFHPTIESPSSLQLVIEPGTNALVIPSPEQLVNFTQAQYIASEGDGLVTLLLERAPSASGTNLVVEIATQDGSAQSQTTDRSILTLGQVGDYEPVHTRITFERGVTLLPVSVRINDDVLEELGGAETFHVLAFVTGADAPIANATVHIIDNDELSPALPALRFAQTRFVGDRTKRYGVVVIVREDVGRQAAVIVRSSLVQYAGTNVAALVYEPRPYEMQYPAMFDIGVSAVTVLVEFSQAALRGAAETINLTITKPPECHGVSVALYCAYRIQNQAARLEINQNTTAYDPGIVGFSRRRIAFAEGAGVVSVEVHRTTTFSPLNVTFAVDSAATARVTPTKGSIVFEQGQMVATMTLTLIDDDRSDSDVTFSASITRAQPIATQIGTVSDTPIALGRAEEQPLFATVTITLIDEVDVPGVVGFASTQIVAKELSGFVAIELHRAFGSSGSITVRLSISVSNHTTDDESPPRDSFGLETFAMQSSGYLVTFEDGVVRKSVNVRLTDDYCQENPRDVLICTLSMVEHVGPIPSTCEENSCLGIAPSMASILITDREDAPPSSVQRLVFAAGVGNHRPTFELIIPNVAAAPFSLVTIAGGLHDNTTLIWPNASAAYIQHALESLTGIRRVEVRASNATAELDARRFTLLFLDAYLVIDTLFVTVVEKKSSSSDGGGGVAAAAAVVTITPIPSHGNETAGRKFTQPPVVALRDSCDRIAINTTGLTARAALLVSSRHECLNGSAQTMEHIREVQRVEIEPLQDLGKISIAPESTLAFTSQRISQHTLPVSQQVLVDIDRVLCNAEVEHGSSEVLMLSLVDARYLAPGQVIRIQGEAYTVVDSTIRTTAAAPSVHVFLNVSYEGPTLLSTQVFVTPQYATISGFTASLPGFARLTYQSHLVFFGRGGNLTEEHGGRELLAAGDFVRIVDVELEVAGVDQGSSTFTLTHPYPMPSQELAISSVGGPGRWVVRLASPIHVGLVTTVALHRNSTLVAGVTISKGGRRATSSHDLRKEGLVVGDALILTNAREPAYIAAFEPDMIVSMSAIALHLRLELCDALNFGGKLHVGDTIGVGTNAHNTIRRTSTFERYLGRANVVYGSKRLHLVSDLGFFTTSALERGMWIRVGFGSRRRYQVDYIAEDEVGLFTAYDGHAMLALDIYESGSYSTVTKLHGFARVEEGSRVVQFDDGAVELAVGARIQMRYIRNDEEEINPWLAYEITHINRTGSGTFQLNRPYNQSSSPEVHISLHKFCVLLDTPYQRRTPSVVNETSTVVVRKVVNAFNFTEPVQAEDFTLLEGHATAYRDWRARSNIGGAYALGWGSILPTSALLPLNATASDLETAMEEAWSGTFRVELSTNRYTGHRVWSVEFSAPTGRVPLLHIVSTQMHGAFRTSVSLQRRLEVPPLGTNRAGLVVLPVHGSSCGQLRGTLVVTVASDGVAVFDDLRAERALQGAHLGVWIGELTATSAPFSVVSQQARVLRVSTGPIGTLASGEFAVDPRVQLLDNFGGSVVVEDSDTVVTASLGVNHGGVGGGALVSFHAPTQLPITVESIHGRPVLLASSFSAAASITVGTVLRVGNQVYRVPHLKANYFSGEKQHVVVTNIRTGCYHLALNAMMTDQCIGHNASANEVLFALRTLDVVDGAFGLPDGSVVRTTTRNGTSLLYEITFSHMLGDIGLLYVAEEQRIGPFVASQPHNIVVNGVKDGEGELFPRRRDVFSVTMCCSIGLPLMGFIRLRLQFKTFDTLTPPIYITPSNSAQIWEALSMESVLESINAVHSIVVNETRYGEKGIETEHYVQGYEWLETHRWIVEWDELSETLFNATIDVPSTVVCYAQQLRGDVFLQKSSTRVTVSDLHILDVQVFRHSWVSIRSVMYQIAMINSSSVFYLDRPVENWVESVAKMWFCNSSALSITFDHISPLQGIHTGGFDVTFSTTHSGAVWAMVLTANNTVTHQVVQALNHAEGSALCTLNAIHVRPYLTSTWNARECGLLEGTQYTVHFYVARSGDFATGELRSIDFVVDPTNEFVIEPRATPLTEDGTTVEFVPLKSGRVWIVVLHDEEAEDATYETVVTAAGASGSLACRVMRASIVGGGLFTARLDECHFPARERYTLLVYIDGGEFTFGSGIGTLYAGASQLLTPSSPTNVFRGGPRLQGETTTNGVEVCFTPAVDGSAWAAIANSSMDTPLTTTHVLDQDFDFTQCKASLLTVHALRESCISFDTPHLGSPCTLVPGLVYYVYVYLTDGGRTAQRAMAEGHDGTLARPLRIRVPGNNNFTISPKILGAITQDGFTLGYELVDIGRVWSAIVPVGTEFGISEMLSSRHYSQSQNRFEHALGSSGAPRAGNVTCSHADIDAFDGVNKVHPRPKNDWKHGYVHFFGCGMTAGAVYDAYLYATDGSGAGNGTLSKAVKVRVPLSPSNMFVGAGVHAELSTDPSGESAAPTRHVSSTAAPNSEPNITLTFTPAVNGYFWAVLLRRLAVDGPTEDLNGFSMDAVSIKQRQTGPDRLAEGRTASGNETWCRRSRVRVRAMQPRTERLHGCNIVASDTWSYALFVYVEDNLGRNDGTLSHAIELRRAPHLSNIFVELPRLRDPPNVDGVVVGFLPQQDGFVWAALAPATAALQLNRTTIQSMHPWAVLGHHERTFNCRIKNRRIYARRNESIKLWGCDLQPNLAYAVVLYVTVANETARFMREEQIVVVTNARSGCYHLALHGLVTSDCIQHNATANAMLMSLRTLDALGTVGLPDGSVTTAVQTAHNNISSIVYTITFSYTLGDVGLLRVSEKHNMSRFEANQPHSIVVSSVHDGGAGSASQTNGSLEVLNFRTPMTPTTLFVKPLLIARGSVVTTKNVPLTFTPTHSGYAYVAIVRNSDLPRLSHDHMKNMTFAVGRPFCRMRAVRVQGYRAVNATLDGCDMDMLVAYSAVALIEGESQHSTYIERNGEGEMSAPLALDPTIFRLQPTVVPGSVTTDGLVITFALDAASNVSLAIFPRESITESDVNAGEDRFSVHTSKVLQLIGASGSASCQLHGVHMNTATQHAPSQVPLYGCVLKPRHEFVGFIFALPVNGTEAGRAPRGALTFPNQTMSRSFLIQVPSTPTNAYHITPTVRLSMSPTTTATPLGHDTIEIMFVTSVSGVAWAVLIAGDNATTVSAQDVANTINASKTVSPTFRCHVHDQNVTALQRTNLTLSSCMMRAGETYSVFVYVTDFSQRSGTLSRGVVVPLLSNKFESAPRLITPTTSDGFSVRFTPSDSGFCWAMIVGEPAAATIIDESGVEDGAHAAEWVQSSRSAAGLTTDCRVQRLNLTASVEATVRLYGCSLPAGQIFTLYVYITGESEERGSLSRGITIAVPTTPSNIFVVSPAVVVPLLGHEHAVTFKAALNGTAWVLASNSTLLSSFNVRMIQHEFLQREYGDCTARANVTQMSTHTIELSCGESHTHLLVYIEGLWGGQGTLSFPLLVKKLPPMHESVIARPVTRDTRAQGTIIIDPVNQDSFTLRWLSKVSGNASALVVAAVNMHAVSAAMIVNPSYAFGLTQPRIYAVGSKHCRFQKRVVTAGFEATAHLHGCALALHPPCTSPAALFQDTKKWLTHSDSVDECSATFGGTGGLCTLRQVADVVKTYHIAYPPAEFRRIAGGLTVLPTKVPSCDQRTLQDCFEETISYEPLAPYALSKGLCCPQSCRYYVHIVSTDVDGKTEHFPLREIPLPRTPTNMLAYSPRLRNATENGLAITFIPTGDGLAWVAIALSNVAPSVTAVQGSAESESGWTACRIEALPVVALVEVEVTLSMCALARGIAYKVYVYVSDARGISGSLAQGVALLLPRSHSNTFLVAPALLGTVTVGGFNLLYTPKENGTSSVVVAPFRSAGNTPDRVRSGAAGLQRDGCSITYHNISANVSYAHSLSNCQLATGVQYTAFVVVEGTNPGSLPPLIGSFSFRVPITSTMSFAAFPTVRNFTANSFTVSFALSVTGITWGMLVKADLRKVPILDVVRGTGAHYGSAPCTFFLRTTAREVHYVTIPGCGHLDVYDGGAYTLFVYASGSTNHAEGGALQRLTVLPPVSNMFITPPRVEGSLGSDGTSILVETMRSGRIWGKVVLATIDVQSQSHAWFKEDTDAMGNGTCRFFSANTTSLLHAGVHGMRISPILRGCRLIPHGAYKLGIYAEDDFGGHGVIAPTLLLSPPGTPTNSFVGAGPTVTTPTYNRFVLNNDIFS